MDQNGFYKVEKRTKQPDCNNAYKSVETVIIEWHHRDTNNEYNIMGFKVDGIHKSTKNQFAPNGFDIKGYNINGFDIDGIHKETGNSYDLSGYDLNGFNDKGYNKIGFNIEGVHCKNPTIYTKDLFKDFNRIYDGDGVVEFYDLEKLLKVYCYEKNNDGENNLIPTDLMRRLILLNQHQENVIDYLWRNDFYNIGVKIIEIFFDVLIRDIHLYNSKTNKILKEAILNSNTIELEFDEMKTIISSIEGTLIFKNGGVVVKHLENPGRFWLLFENGGKTTLYPYKGSETNWI